MKTSNQEISLRVINKLDLSSYFFFFNFAFLVFTVGFIALAKYIVSRFLFFYAPNSRVKNNLKT